MSELLFYMLATGLILSSIGVAFSAYPIRSALYLMVSFLMTSVLWLDLGAEFLALALIFIYVGAVMVLFLFIVFMLNANKVESVSIWQKGCGLLCIIGMCFYVLSKVQISGDMKPVAMMENTRYLGMMLYNEYWVSFEIVGMILLVAMISVFVMVDREKHFGKRQDINQQIKRKSEDCIQWME